MLLKDFAAFMRMINQNEELLSFLGLPLFSLIPASDEKRGRRRGECNRYQHAKGAKAGTETCVTVSVYMSCL